jgi:hypothetical protein
MYQFKAMYHMKQVELHYKCHMQTSWFTSPPELNIIKSREFKSLSTITVTTRKRGSKQRWGVA